MRPFEVGPESQGFSFQAERIFTAYVFPPAWDNNKNLNNKSNPKPPSFGARCSSPLKYMGATSLLSSYMTSISLDDPCEHEPTFIHQPMKIKLLKRGAAVPLNTAKLNITNC